ncbi:MAG: Imm51 family immunity protein [Polyangiaceae bacterium]
MNGPTDERSYWPCVLIAHEQRHSITLGGAELELLAHHFKGRDAGGYAVEAFVKRLARSKAPGVLRRVSFDSEASMFCAVSEDVDALHALATLLTEATGTTEADATARFASPSRPALTQGEEDEARACLLAGFVFDLDPAQQSRFYELVPTPPLGSQQRELLGELCADDPQRRLDAAKRIRRAAEHGVWDWQSFVGDPRVVSELIAALDRELDLAVLAELLTAAAHTCARHLPDLRFRASFERLLGHSAADVRRRATQARSQLFEPFWEALAPLFEDRDVKVRSAAVDAAMCGEEPFSASITGEYGYTERRQPIPDTTYAQVLGALRDKNAAVRTSAAAAVAAIDHDDAEEILRSAAAREKVGNVRAALERALDEVSMNAPFRPCRRGPALELTRFSRLHARGLGGPDVERALRERHAELLADVEIASRRGYFAAWERDHTVDGQPLQAIAAAIRALR